MNLIKRYYKERFKEIDLSRKNEEFKPNRAKRRETPKRFLNNRKTTPLTVHGIHKYLRILDVQNDKNGNTKHIYHYQLRGTI